MSNLSDYTFVLHDSFLMDFERGIIKNEVTGQEWTFEEANAMQEDDDEPET